MRCLSRDIRIRFSKRRDELGQKEVDCVSDSRKWRADIGDRQCALQGLEIIRVETPSGKELTTPPEVSFELLVVTLVAKRKQ